MWLQTATPGTTQVGNVNVNGTVIGGFVTATNLSSSVGSSAIKGIGDWAGVFGESSLNSIGRGVYGLSTSPTGGYGVIGEAGGTGSAGVRGVNVHTTGIVYGIQGTADSPSGYAVYGLNTADTGDAIGVYGSTFSVDGIGVRGFASEAATE